MSCEGGRPITHGSFAQFAVANPLHRQKAARPAEAIAILRDMDDEQVEPLLGKIRARPSRGGRRYAGMVIAMSALLGKGAANANRHRLSRIGRGAAAAAVIGHGGRSRSRRAIVKTRLVRLHGQAVGAARAHLRYIQRDGTQRDGSLGRLFSAAGDDADPDRFVERCSGDRHQFRIILSPEDGDRYEDLTPLVRKFMARMEEDLGTKLEWVAANHVDTGHPHSHIILRGKDDEGKNLIIARDYIAAGMRSRLSGLVSNDLGPRTSLEIGRQLRREVDLERLTSLDRSLQRSVGDDGLLVPGGRSMADHSVRLSRLRKLEQLGLASPETGGRWRLAGDLEGKLRALGERGDIIRTMQRAMARAKVERRSSDFKIYREARGGIIGRLVERGLSDELGDRHYLIVDALDGSIYHVDPGRGSSLADLPSNSVLSIVPGGSPEGVGVDLVSPLPLGRLAHYDGATWLDRMLADDSRPATCDRGFGREVNRALAVRQAWLAANGLGFMGEAGALANDALRLLEERDLHHAAAAIQARTGLDFAKYVPGDRIEGILRQHVDLGSGRFAMVECGRQFLLLPWRPTLDRLVDRPVSGIWLGPGREWLPWRERGLSR